MSWQNIKLVFFREMRDQLRDRRTLFMIAVLPILFYPLLGVSFLQIAQFLKKHESRILIVGEPSVREIPGLLDGDTFAAGLIDEDLKGHFLSLEEIDFYNKHKEAFTQPGGLPEELFTEFRETLNALVDEYDCDAVVYYPPGIAKEITEYAEVLEASQNRGVEAPPVPQPKVMQAPGSSDKVVLGGARARRAVGEITYKVKQDAATEVKMKNLLDYQEPEYYASEDTGKRVNASLWSKILPFVLMIWAVTGAFYPAVDLCAGEKERGTLETLLSSPARRSEIVMGKLLTVTLFSVSTALLNLFVMFGTGAVVLSQIGQQASLANVGPPPIAALGWSVLLIFPVAILVSAVCLALAALAKSTKEGQHYLAPVMLVALPLTLLPMAPQVELNFGFSLIPISGIVLVMRSLLEGTFAELWPYSIVVAIVTFACCWWSIRWAIEQFNSETVMFRGGERWNFGTWVKQLARDRQATPTVAQALLCALVILIVRFFLTLFMAGSDIPDTFRVFFQQTFISIVVGVAVPAMLMTIMLTRNPRRTLLVEEPPRLITIPLAALFALAMVPLALLLQSGLHSLLPLNPNIHQYLNKMAQVMDSTPSALLPIAVIALLPAVFEELTFRGFILSGFRHTGHKWRAIVLSSLFFALAHGVMQQEINAFLLGLVLGYIAIQTGSLLPCVAFHFVYNATQYLISTHRFPLRGIVEDIAVDPYQWAPIVLASLLTCGLLAVYLHRLPYRRTREEDLVESIQRENARQLAS